MRAAAAPGQLANGRRRPVNGNGRLLQRLRQVIGQRLAVFVSRLAQPAQLLLAKAARGLPAQAPGQLRVVAVLGVRVQRQVVGVKGHIVRQQARKALLHPARDAPVLPAPEQAVVHEDGIGPGGYGRLNQRQAGRHAADQLANSLAALHLQAVGPVVLE